MLGRCGHPCRGDTAGRALRWPYEHQRRLPRGIVPPWVPRAARTISAWFRSSMLAVFRGTRLLGLGASIGAGHTRLAGCPVPGTSAVVGAARLSSRRSGRGRTHGSPERLAAGLTVVSVYLGTVAGHVRSSGVETLEKETPKNLGRRGCGDCCRGIDLVHERRGTDRPDRTNRGSYHELHRRPRHRLHLQQQG